MPILLIHRLLGPPNRRTLSLTCGQRSHIFSKISFLALNLAEGHCGERFLNLLPPGRGRSQVCAERAGPELRTKANAMVRGSPGVVMGSHGPSISDVVIDVAS